MNGIGRILNLLRKETPSPGTNYTGTVTKVEGGVAYVQLAGSDIDDTPVRMSVAAKKGDTVRVTVNKGKAWITGNDTAPPTDDSYAKESKIVLSNEIEKTNVTLKRVDDVATEAHKIAGNTDQYFWHVTSGTDTGAHLTEKPQEEFLADPENGGGNLLARSNGIAIRDGLTELAQFSADGISFVDPHGVGVFDESISGTSTNAYFSETYTSEQFGPTESYTITLNNPYFLPDGESAEGAISIDLDIYDDAVNPPDTISETLGPIQLDTALSRTMCNDILLVEYDPDTRTIRITCENQGYVSYAVSVTVEWAVRIRPASLSFGTRYGTRGAYSSTFGLGLKAERREQVAIGAYNENTYKNLFEIGMGTGDTNRKTVFSVDDDGNVNAKGFSISDWSSTSFSNSTGAILAHKSGRMVWVHGYHTLNAGVTPGTDLITLPWKPIEVVSVPVQNDAAGAYYSGYIRIDANGVMEVGTSWSGYTRYSFTYMTND